MPAKKPAFLFTKTYPAPLAIAGAQMKNESPIRPLFYAAPPREIGLEQPPCCSIYPG